MLLVRYSSMFYEIPRDTLKWKIILHKAITVKGRSKLKIKNFLLTRSKTGTKTKPEKKVIDLTLSMKVPPYQHFHAGCCG